MKNLKVFLFSTVLSISTMYGQKPTVTPNPSDTPLDFSDPANIILFIVLPICAVVFYFMWRAQQKKDKE